MCRGFLSRGLRVWICLYFRSAINVDDDFRQTKMMLKMLCKWLNLVGLRLECSEVESNRHAHKSVALCIAAT